MTASQEFATRMKEHLRQSVAESQSKYKKALGEYVAVFGEDVVKLSTWWRMITPNDTYVFLSFAEAMEGHYVSNDFIDSEYNPISFKDKRISRFKNSGVWQEYVRDSLLAHGCVVLPEDVTTINEITFSPQLNGLVYYNPADMQKAMSANEFYLDLLESMEDQSDSILRKSNILSIEKSAHADMFPSRKGYWKPNLDLIKCDITISVIRAIREENGFFKYKPDIGYPARIGDIARYIAVRALYRNIQLKEKRSEWGIEQPIISEALLKKGVYKAIQLIGNTPEISVASIDDGEISIMDIFKFAEIVKSQIVNDINSTLDNDRPVVQVLTPNVYIQSENTCDDLSYANDFCVAYGIDTDRIFGLL